MNIEVFCRFVAVYRLRLTKVLFILLSFSSLSAAEIQVEKVVIGLDGYVRPDRWIPVVFFLQNTGENFQGSLEVLKGDTVFRKSLDLGAGTRKRVELVYYHSNYYEPLAYRILGKGEFTWKKERLEPTVLNYQDNLVLSVSDTEYNHQFVNGQPNPWGGKTFVAYARSEDLYSDWIAYSAADAIALGSFSPATVTPPRWQELIQYAASGGVLICSAGTSLSVLKNPLIRDNLPQISAELNLVSHADFLITRWTTGSSSPLPPVSIPSQTITPRPCDQKLVTIPEGTSLITSSPYYKGNIIYFGFDYTRLPEEIRGVFAPAWNELIFNVSSTTPPTFGLVFRKRLEENPKVQSFLYGIPGLQLPDAKWFALFFFVYVCAIGPFQFLLLRALKRNLLLWTTFPTIILLFAVLSFGYSKYLHSSESRITQVAVVESFPALGRQTIYQAYATAMTESGTFRFQAVPEGSYLRKFVPQALTYQPEPYTLSEDLPRELQGETLKSWTFRTFDAIHCEPLSVPVRVSFHVHGNRLNGQIINDSRASIQESFFAYDFKNAASLGMIAPGATRNFSLTLNNTTLVPSAGPHLRDLLHLYNLSYATPHFFFGQMLEERGTLLINGKHRSTTLRKYIAVFVNSDEAGPVNLWGTTQG